MATSPTPAIFLFLWFLCASNFNQGLCTLKVHCNKNDQQALLFFKQGVVDPTGLLSSWSINTDCCQWNGVQCDNITGRVTGLSLPCPYYDYNGNYYDKSKCLGGQINLPLFQLEFLEYLDLKENEFKGIDLCPTHVNHNLSRPVSPQECDNFSKLLNLDLSYNNDLHVGDLLWIYHLPSLKFLNLSGIDLHMQTHWVWLMTKLPALSVLKLRNCQLGNIHPPLGWYVNSSSLQSLDLSYNFFDSRMFKWISNLTSLSHLTLQGNHFRGPIPNTVLRLRNLKSLGLAFNEFDGSIPEWLGQYEFLEILDLYVNSFSGPIPTTLGNLSSLIFIDISVNQLNDSLPESLGKLSKLEELRVGRNPLVGVISEKNFAKLWSLELIDFSEISLVFNLDSNWTPPIHLKYIHLYGTMMGSIFPSWLYSLGSLHYLNVSSSKISSIDPDKFWSLARRTYAFDASNNLIGGDLSNVLLNSSWIDLRNNKFKEGVPRLSPNVTILNLANNSFSGPMSPLLCHPMTRRNKLAFLDMSHNQLSGELPDCFANWQSLVYVNLGNNMFTGKIPDSVGSLSALQSIHLPKNEFFGAIPASLRNCRNLRLLDLGENKLSGNIPSWVGANMRALKLRSNQFIGSIPTEICQLSSLMILDLAGNNLSGPIPKCLHNITAMVSASVVDEHEFDVFAGNSNFGIYSPDMLLLLVKGQELSYRKILKWLHIIDLSCNNVSGILPSTLFSLTSLQSLNLSRNQLIGEIPKEIGRMTLLESLDLSINQLSGHIPESLTMLSFLSYVTTI